MQFMRQFDGGIYHFLLQARRQRYGGIHRNRVPGMHAGPLYMLHDAGNQHVFAVANGVHFKFFAI